MSQRSSRLVTLLLTDVEGSTRHWETAPELMNVALARHDGIVSDHVKAAGGTLVKSRGEGDSCFAVFEEPSSAVGAAFALQRALLDEPWPGSSPIKVRMALNTGLAVCRDGDYFGSAVNRCARLRGVGHGGQILLSRTTWELAREDLPELSIRDLGLHRLRDVSEPEHVYQLWHPSLPVDFPALLTIGHGRHNLPVRRKELVGRDAAATSAEELLRNQGLVTMTGPAGVGKTGLALLVAENVVSQFRDGVWLVELAAVADAELVAQMVAYAVGAPLQAGRPLLDIVSEYLTDKEMLIVLDNCEHLLEAVANVVDRLLQTCPGVRILATSREPLAVAGEATRRVSLLSVPDAVGGGMAMEDLHSYDAARLFVLLAGDDIEAGPSTAAAIAQICCQLDGLPLAIELAAARARTLPLEEIAARLNNCFELLTAGTRSALPRHQTLRAALDWSYDLLRDDERALFNRLAVFSGGFSLSAASEVCSGGVVDPKAIVGLLASVVDKSLVVRSVRAPGRYQLLETVRQYATTRFEELGDEQLFKARHATWALALARSADVDFGTPAWESATNVLHVEHANLLAALEWALSGGDLETGRDLAATLARWWVLSGRSFEALDYMERAAAVPHPAPHVSARLVLGRAWAAYEVGDFALAERLASDGLQAAVASAEPELEAWGRNLLAGMCWSHGDADGIRRVLSGVVGERVDKARGTRPSASRSRSYVYLMNAAFLDGDFAEGLQLGQAAIRLARDSPARSGLAIASIASVNHALAVGDGDLAVALADDVVEAAEANPDPLSQTLLPWVQTQVFAYVGDLAAAKEAARRCHEADRPGGVRFAGVMARFADAVVTAASGDRGGARRALRDAVRIARQINYRPFEVGYLSTLAVMAVLDDDPIEARGLIDECVVLVGNSRRTPTRIELRFAEGLLAWQTGDKRAAHRRLCDVAAARVQIGALPDAADTIEMLGCLAADMGRWRDAARLLAAAEGARDRLHYAGPRPTAGRDRAENASRRVDEVLGHDLFAKISEEGRLLDLQTAVSDAMKLGSTTEALADGPLSRREGEVARLVSRGLTNRQIADVLNVAERTAENHVQHILTKLGFQTRTQIAAWVAAKPAD